MLLRRDVMVKAIRRSRTAAASKGLHSYMGEAAGTFRAGKDFGVGGGALTPCQVDPLREEV
jgi:hypothetical protein